MNTNDSILHITLMDGMVRGLLLTGTDTVREMRRIHGTSAVATAALGRTLLGTAMLGCMLKDARQSVTVTIDGGGPMGKLIAVADQTTVRGVCDDPTVVLPLKANGKLDVSGAVGHEGRMSVVKDLLMKNPYIGQVALQSGEIAEDFASYFVTSEQQPSLVSLGVLVAGDTVLSAGGVLLQPLPGCEESVISDLELRSPLMGDVSRELAREPFETLMKGWFDGLKPVVLERTPLSYQCSCSRERMEKALIALGQKELEQMIAEEKDGAELCCHFCKKCEHFSTHDLIRLLNKATKE